MAHFRGDVGQSVLRKICREKRRKMFEDISLQTHTHFEKFTWLKKRGKRKVRPFSVRVI